MIPDNLVAPVYAASYAAVLASFAGWLPPVASIFAIVVCLITIYESRTFTRWWANHIRCQRAKKLARLRAKEKLVIAEIMALETKRAAKVEASEMVLDAAATAAQLVVREAAAVAAALK